MASGGTTGPQRDRPEPMDERRRAIERMAQTIAHDVATLENSTIDALLPALLEARDELRRGLAEWLAKKDGEDRFTAQELRRGLVSIEAALKTIAGMRPELEATIGASTDAAAGLAAGHLQEELARFGAKFGETFRPTQISTAAIIAKTKHEIIPKIRTSSKRYVGAVHEDMRRQLQIGLAKGETFTELTNRLRRLGGPRGLVALRGVVGEPGAQVEDIAEGLFNRYRHWAERVVRTEVINAYNVEHVAGIELINEDLEEGDEPLYLRWDSSPDRRRCEFCRELDGRITKPGKPFRPGILQPPAHPNCRCVAVAWHPSWGDIEGEQKPTSAARSASKALTPAARSPKPRSPTSKKPRSKPTTKPTAQLPAQPAVPPPPPGVAAMSKGRVHDARLEIDDMLEKRGLAKRAETTPASTTTRSPTLIDRGVHDLRTGDIEINAVVADNGAAFAAEFAKDPAGTTAALQAFAKERDAYLRGKQPKLDMTTPAAKLYIHVNDYRTMFHEALHGFGPLGSYMYAGDAAIVEEAATEVTARKLVREQFGIDIKALAIPGIDRIGSYEEEIRRTVKGIAKATGLPRSKAFTLFEEAAEEYKRTPAKQRSPRDLLAEIVLKLAPNSRAKSPADISREMLRAWMAPPRRPRRRRRGP